MTDFWTILIIAFGLAMDCFAVSLCIGSSPASYNRRSIFRVSFHFGLFQGAMTLLGWLLGSTIVDLIANFDHWIALALLGWIGGRMIMEGFSRNDASPVNGCDDPSRGSSLVMLSIATSIDALAVGVSFAFLDVNVIEASSIIAATTFLLSAIGVRVGCFFGTRFKSRAELAGGLVLIAIGTKILVEHLLG